MPNSKQHTIAGLLATGWTLDTTARTSKYLVYTKADETFRLLVGKSGALRQASRTVSDSQSITGGKRHLALQAVGQSAKSLSSVDQAQRMFEANM